MRLVRLTALLLLTAALTGCIGAGDPVQPQTTVETPAPGGFSDTHVFPGNYDGGEPYAMVLEQGPYDALPGEALYLTSEADGVDIEVGVVRPDVPDGTQVPVIGFASPYLSPLHATDLQDLRPRLTENFVSHGYAVAFIAVRGTADSGGCIELFGPNERADLDQAVTWLGTQDWSNGNVGLIGVSYDGSTPWMVAAAGNPHLKTIVPISGLSDVFDLEFRNGTTETRMLGVVNLAYYASGFAFNNPANGRGAVHTAEGVACPGVVEGISASLASFATGERDPLGYFEERNQRPGVETNYEGSIFLIHGLQDWNVDPHHAYPWVNQLEDQGFTVKHLLGQWGHAWPDGDYLDEDQRRLDFAQVLLHWFDHELKGNTTVDLGPRAQVQDNAGQWRSADTWPPRDTTPLRLYLAPSGLTDEEPSDTANTVLPPDTSIAFTEPTAFTPNVCDTCAFWRSDPLEEDLRFAGMPTVHVTVTPTAPAGSIAAFLYGWDGNDWTFHGWTSMDLRFHQGGATASTVVPGQPLVAKMQLEPLDIHVPAGQELVLMLAAGQQHDRLNPGMGAPLLVEAGPNSVLTLDTFTVDQAQLFTPPS